MAKKKAKRRKTLAKHVLIFTLLLAVVFILRIASTELPQSFIDAISRAVSTERYSVELGRASISLPRGRLDVGSLEIYEKGALGNALVQMKDVSIKIRPKRQSHPLTWVRHLDIGELQIPNRGYGQSGHGYKDDYPSLLPDFGPVDFSCGRFVILGASANDIKGTLSSTNATLFLTDAQLHTSEAGAGGQTVYGKVSFSLEDFSVASEAAGTIDPNRLRPIFLATGSRLIASEIARMQFPESPPKFGFRIDFSPSRQIRDMVLDISSGYCIYNDVPLSTVRATLRAGGTNEWDFVEIRPLAITRPEGFGQGGLLINRKDSRLSFDASSTIDPLHVLRIIRITNRSLKLPLTFDNPAHITAAGKLDLSENPTDTDISGTASSPGVASYGFKFQNAKADFHISDTAWSVTNISASISGGEAKGTALFTPNPEDKADVNMDINAEFNDVSYVDLASLITQTPENPNGRMDMRLSLHGQIETNATEFLTGLTGDAKVEIRDASLYLIPIFAGLTEELAANVPGVDFLVAQDDLSAQLIFSDGIAKVPEFKISGRVFSTTGSGTIALDGNINLRVKGHFLDRKTLVGKGFYYFLMPVSKIFEFRATGHVSAPTWSSVILTSEP